MLTTLEDRVQLAALPRQELCPVTLKELYLNAGKFDHRITVCEYHELEMLHVTAT